MSDTDEKLLIQLLSDGKFLSGEKIAGHLGISRTSVWKKIQSVKHKYNLDIHAVSGKGYRLPQGIDLLNERKIRNLLPTEFLSEINFLKIFDCIDSTNRYLLDCDEIEQGSFSICFSEMQTEGRGRRGRQWISPFGKNIHLSVACHLNMSMMDIAGISIAIGVAVADAVSHIGLKQVALKWPNDIHVSQSKIAGILVEVKGEADGPVKTVVGIGLNVDLPVDLMVEINQPVTDLNKHLDNNLPGRNEIASTLVKYVCQAIDRFVGDGLADFIQRWRQYDHYLGQEVTIKSASHEVQGIYLGLDANGALLLENHRGIQVFNAGEVSLRTGAKLT